MKENLRETLLGGQCFSWSEISEGVYGAVLNDRVYTVSDINDAYRDDFLYSYFDLDYDYEKARREISHKDAILKEAVENVGNIRILKQDKWLTTISFILSQNNNIKRIKLLYDRLSKYYGRAIESDLYSFPTPDEMKNASEKELRDLGVGFRAPYILDAIDNCDILSSLDSLDFDQAMSKLQKIKGIGPKVASCILIYSDQRREGFPMDVWMKRVMNTYYKGKTSDYFAPYQALSQQYLFSWIRG